MKTSKNGLITLHEREGARHKAYRDTKGIWTIGVGHTGPEVVEGLVWTDEQIDMQLQKDVAIAEGCVNKAVKIALTQFQFDALVSFVFNVGVGAFQRSTMLKKLNAGDIAGATKEFDRWHIPPEITSRRNSEKLQFAGA